MSEHSVLGLDRENARALASEGVSDTLDIASKRIASRGALKAGAHVAGKVGARLIPFVGEALMAYEVADLGYQAATGHGLGETRIGGALEGGVGAVGRGAIWGVSKTLSMVGLGGASRFVGDDVRNFIYSDDEKASTTASAKERLDHLGKGPAAAGPDPEASAARPASGQDIVGMALAFMGETGNVPETLAPAPRRAGRER